MISLSIKIAVISGPGTGKTTLCKEVDNILGLMGKNSGLCLEFARTYVNRFGPPANVFEQFVVYQGQKRREDDLARCEYIICDNATFLCYVYATFNIDFRNDKERYALNELYNMALKDMFSYDEIFYIPREFSLSRDGTRYQGEEEALLVDEKIRAFLLFHNLPYTTVKGTVRERCATILEKLGFTEEQYGVHIAHITGTNS